jgi:hypothetical protein
MNKLIIKVTLITVALLLCIATFFYVKSLLNDISKYSNNYNAQVQATIFWQAKSGERVARTQAIILSKNEIINSKDIEIKALTSEYKNLGLKNRKLVAMLSIKADTIFNTTVKSDTVRISKNVLVVIDSLSIGDLHIKRVQDLATLDARYTVKYSPTIYVYVSWSKEDKWRLINLIIPRKKTYFVDVITKDKLINIVGVKAILKD